MFDSKKIWVVIDDLVVEDIRCGVVVPRCRSLYIHGVIFLIYYFHFHNHTSQP